MDLRTWVGSVELPNPILVASGTFGYAREAAPFVELGRLGGIVPKTVTLAPRVGNKPPRVVETAAGMLNAIGLDNDGVDYFLTHHLPFLRECGAPIIVNVAGKNVDEFALLVERVGRESGLAAIELNLSCPNVSGGTDFATNPRLAEDVLHRARSACGLPLWAKLTPNVTDLVEVVDAVGRGGADAVTLINTVLGTAIDWRRRRPILSSTFGGLSGPAIKPIALRCVLQAARRSKLPIVAVGGIRNVDDAMEFLISGAAAVQVGTANFFDPTAAMSIIDRLPAALAELGVESVRAAIGSLRSE